MREARARNEQVHLGYLFGICVEKNSEMSPELRKYKYRVVFQGNRVVDQNYEAAIFQDLGSTPATIEASRVADAFGAQDGWATEVADAEQAYVQADMKGTSTWVCLPPNQRRGKAANMTQPVYNLKKALYGHPDAGTFWEEKCDQHVRKVGFEPVGEEWPSCYVHKRMNLFLVIYVDDFQDVGSYQITVTRVEATAQRLVHRTRTRNRKIRH